MPLQRNLLGDLQGKTGKLLPLVTNDAYRVHCIVELREGSYGIFSSRAAMG
jgi:hypothetical protein